MLDIANVGDFKLNYPDHKNIKFENLDFYITLAKKNVSKFADKVCVGYAKKILQDEDAIANIAHHVMMADWRWDASKKGATGESKTRYSYRNQCAIWAIKSYISRQYKINKKYRNTKTFSFDACLDDDLQISKILPDNKSQDPADIVQNNEIQYKLSSDINTILHSDIISKRQSEYIKMYFFEQMTLEQIGKKFGITREAVRQNLNRAYETIRDIAND